MVAALTYTLWFVFAGFGNHQDPLYWLYKYEHLEGGWMAMGTLLTGGAVVHLFGAQLLPLRLFGWFCTVVAIALPYVCLLTKKQRQGNLHWLALTFVLMGYGAFQEFSPGTLSVLLLSALWVTAAHSTMHPSSHSSFASAVLLGLAITARFPNILALLVLIPVWRKKCLWNIPVAAVVAGIVYLLGYWLVTPAVTDATMRAAHELTHMMSKLWEHGGLLVGYMLLALGMITIGNYKWENLTPKLAILNHKLAFPLGLFIGLALIYFLTFTTKPAQWYNIDLTYMISALCLVIALNHRIFVPSIGAAILIIATFGTDTAWLKLFPAVLCLLPIAAVHYSRESRQYLYAALGVLAIFVATRMTTNSVGQSDLTKATTFASVSPYKGIAIRVEEEQKLLQYKADCDSITRSTLMDHPSTILALGQESHLMRAVTGCEAAKYNEFWSNIFDSVYTAKYQELIQAEHPIVFCSFTPQFKTKKTYTDGASAMEEMLRREGYTPLDRSKHKYMIYLPQQNTEN